MENALKKNLKGEQLREYIEKVKELEVGRYQLMQMENLISNELYQLTHLEYTRFEVEKRVDGMDLLFDDIIENGGGIGVIGAIIILVISRGNISIALKFGIIFWIIGASLYVRNSISKNKKENDSIKERNQKIHYSNTLRRVNAEGNRKVLIPILNSMLEKRKETENVLEKLYSLNIIYPKYRGLVPICSIYDYLCSGKCYALEGHEGAYNLYDYELYQKQIITQLDKINQKLDIVIQNQYSLYTAITENNNMLQKLNKNISCNGRKLNEIALNTEMNTYWNSITAKNTTYLKWAQIMNSNY